MTIKDNQGRSRLACSEAKGVTLRFHIRGPQLRTHLMREAISGPQRQ